MLCSSVAHIRHWMLFNLNALAWLEFHYLAGRDSHWLFGQWIDTLTLGTAANRETAEAFDRSGASCYDILFDDLKNSIDTFGCIREG